MDIQTLLSNSADHLSWWGWVVVICIAWGQIEAAKARASFRKATSARLESLSKAVVEMRTQANEIEDRVWTITKTSDEIKAVLTTAASRIQYMDEAIVAVAACPAQIQYLEASVTAICGTLGQMHARSGSEARANGTV